MIQPDSILRIRPNPLNFAICLLDTFSFNFGMAFWSLTTIVPLFLHQLHASNALIGALPGLVALGYSLPGLLVARRVARLTRAKWWLFWVAVAERIPLLAVALAIPALGPKNPQLIITLFVAAFAVHALCLGLNQPAYWSFIGKTIPAHVRGRVYGWAGALGAVAGLSVDPITRHYLTHAGMQSLHGFADCFLIGMGILIPGILPFCLIDEPAGSGDAPADRHAGHFLYDALHTWRSEASFRRIVMSQIAAGAATLAQPFYVLQYARSFKPDAVSIALFTTITVVCTALGSLASGILADRWGNKLVLTIGAVLSAVGPAFVLCNPPRSAYDAIFVVVGLSIGALGLGSYNIVIEYAGSGEFAPYYTAIFNAVLTPSRTLAPIIGGILADRAGYTSVFVAGAAIGLVSILTILRVRDPRWRGELAEQRA